jgi:hypothetical protein
MAADRMVKENEMTLGNNLLVRRRVTPARRESLQIRCDGREVDSRTSFASWVRDLTPSLVNTLPR